MNPASLPADTEAANRNAGTEDKQTQLLPRLRKTPFETSPFVDKEDKNTELPNAVTIKSSDLLLDIAATTTIASLTDGTDILETSGAVSYVTFLGLTWWIWASQVLYNVRYRQRDWVHHTFVILQLLVFCSLAAFAGGFDIGQGIVSDEAEESQQATFADSSTSFISGDLATENERSNFLSRVNSTGISTVMLLSRLVLLVQYARVWSCASKAGSSDFVNESIVHVVSLTASALAYSIAIIVVRTDDPDATRGHSVGKVLLWIIPIIWEIIAHMYVNWNMQCHSRDDNNEEHDIPPVNPRSKWLLKGANEIITRADTVFLIFLGAGLDKITSGFQRIAGNVNVNGRSVMIIFAAGIIFVTQLTLYFNLHKRIEQRMEYRNVLMWYFLFFFYIVALILTLQGTAALVELGNLVNSMNLPLDIIYEIGAQVTQPPRLFNSTLEFPNLDAPLARAGVSLENAVTFLNSGTEFFNSPGSPEDAILGINRSDPVGAVLGLVRLVSVLVLQTVLKNLDAEPDPSSVLGLRITDFSQVQFMNSSDLDTRTNRERFAGIIDDVRKLHTEPARWFFGAAGATLVVQFGLWWRLYPDWYKVRPPFEIWIQSLRLFFGAVIILFLIATVFGTSSPPDISGRFYVFHDKLLQEWAQSGVMLIITAAFMLVEQIFEQIVEYHTDDPKKVDMTATPGGSNNGLRSGVTEANASTS